MTDEVQGYGERRFGRFNWLGVWTLYKKEVLRFAKIAPQTILAPVVTVVLFLLIFSLALGRSKSEIHGIPFAQFLAPGLIMMAIIQNAFANSASSLLISKVQGNVVDFLMPPLSPGELTACFALGGATRGVVVALATALAMLPFAKLEIAHLWAVVYFSVAGSLLLSLIGVVSGIWSEKFDHLATVTNFIIAPLAFLSGTFYSVEVLPPLWRTVSEYNPIFYLIDGIRYGFTGVSDGAVATGAGLSFLLCAAMWGLCYKLFESGYKLKS